MIIEIQTERRRVTEAVNARDAVVQRLADAYESLHQKTVIIEHLQQQAQPEPRGDSPFPFKTHVGGEKVEMLRMRDEKLRSENTIKDLRDEIKFLKETSPGLLKSPDPPPSYEEGALKVCHIISMARNLLEHSSEPRPSQSRPTSTFIPT
jgi:hypothetical protein